MTVTPTLLSVNVGMPRTVDYRGERGTTGIWKQPVDGRIAVSGVNLAGDGQADLSAHGGVDKAVYAYSREDYDWWESELGRSLAPGTFGENLTVAGLDPSTALVGERWRVGSALLEVSEPRFPCFKLGIRMEDPRFLKRFAAARRPGTYLRIVSAGEIGAGDEIEVVERPRHEVTIARFAEAYLGDREQLPELLAADRLSDDWRSWIVERAGA
ncbi:MAG: MOSC domain-containing protein [Actinomycetota bacterium]|nr:MOSC domain-containing protein [Actinomycetota bacterium]